MELIELCRAWMGTHGKLVLAKGGFTWQMVTRGHFPIRGIKGGNSDFDF